MAAPVNFQARARRAVLEYALFRWESAVLVAVTLGMGLLSYSLHQRGLVAGWVWPTWLGCGLFAELWLVYTSLTDPDSHQRIIARLLRETYYPQPLRDPELQAQVDKALDYHGRIEAAVTRWRDTGLKAHLNDTSEQISAWLQNIYTLAQRLDHYLQESQSLSADHQRASQRIAQLRQELELEEATELRRQMELTLTGLERQVHTLKTLRNTMEQAQLQLEHTLSALGTIYSQTMLLEARELDGTRINRVREEISQEIEGLGDILAAMEKVYVRDA